MNMICDIECLRKFHKVFSLCVCSLCVCVHAFCVCVCVRVQALEFESLTLTDLLEMGVNKRFKYCILCCQNVLFMKLSSFTVQKNLR